MYCTNVSRIAFCEKIQKETKNTALHEVHELFWSILAE